MYNNDPHVLMVVFFLARWVDRDIFLTLKRSNMTCMLKFMLFFSKEIRQEMPIRHGNQHSDGVKCTYGIK